MAGIYFRVYQFMRVGEENNVFQDDLIVSVDLSRNWL